MKIEFSEVDDRVIEMIRDENLCSMFGENGNYSLNIKVNDWAKASNFIMSIFYDKEIVELLKDKAGFEVTSVNLYTAIPTGEIKHQLQKLIKYIDTETDKYQF